MTAYATHADVEKYFVAYTISTTSMITDSTIDGICVTEQAVVDAELSRAGYVTPITGVNSLLIMKKLIELRAAAVTWRRVYVTTQSDQSTMADEWRKEADELLTKILSGEVILPDADKADSASVSQAPRYTSQSEIFGRDALDDFVDAHGPA